MADVQQPKWGRPFCILNGHSVRVEQAKAQIARAASKRGVEVEVVVTKHGDDIGALAAQALAEGRQLVVAGGGDGTVNAVAGKLAGADAALGVLPMGTLNHFAKDARLPLDLEAAAQTLFAGRMIEVDVGEVNGRVFVNNSGVGLYPHFVRQREAEERRGHEKRVAFMLALRSVVRRYLHLRVRLHMKEAEALERVTPFLFVGNNRYHAAGPEIGTRSTLNSGRLWVCTAPSLGGRSFVGVTLRALVGREPDEELNVFETEELWVEPATPRANVSFDGEVAVMEAPLHYRIRPRELRLVVPERPVVRLRFPLGS
jgi:diacylglycerol kinase family enzyme